jgi:hypothetical protein
MIPELSWPREYKYMDLGDFRQSQMRNAECGPLIPHSAFNIPHFRRFLLF